MKNMWKERFDKCERIIVSTCASREHEMFYMASEVFGLFAMSPLRKDTETSVEALGSGVYKIVQEAPSTDYWAEGYRCESLVKVYKRGKDTYVRLLESKRLRVHDNPEHDGFVVKTMARGTKVRGDHSIEARLLNWLAEKVEL